MTITDTYIKMIYRFWARIYDNIDRVFHFDRRRVIDFLHIRKEEHILEIGVGTGLNLPHYPPECHVTGIDFSASMLDKAAQKKTSAKVALHVADARRLPFKDNAFDAALATFVLRVSPQPNKIMQEISRVVKQKGRFVVLDQFKGKNRMLLALMQPIKLLLGWGKEYALNELLEGTSWRIISNTRMGAMDNTRLVVLGNRK